MCVMYLCAHDSYDSYEYSRGIEALACALSLLCVALHLTRLHLQGKNFVAQHFTMLVIIQPEVLGTLTSACVKHCDTSTQLNSTGDYGRRADTSYVRIYMSNCIKKLITPSDRFPVPVKSAVKSYLTAWRDQNISNRALNTLTY